MPDNGSGRRKPPPRVAGIRRPTTPAPEKAAPAPEPSTPDDTATTDKPKGKFYKKILPFVGVGIVALLLAWVVNLMSHAAINLRFMHMYTPCMDEFHDGGMCYDKGMSASSGTGSSTAWLVTLIIIWIVLHVVSRRMLKQPDKWIAWGVTTKLVKAIWWILTVFTVVYALVWTINMLV
jgi:hypothetical protein